MTQTTEAKQEQKLATTNVQAALLEKVVIEGDLGSLTPSERVTYYAKVCESLGLNPLTKPFDYLRLNNRLVLYARRDATDQLRAKHGISITITARETINEVYVVTAQATDKSGRTDESTGAVTIKGLAADFLANAYMKAETKAKRRVTLSIVGLGWMDETEIETVKEVASVVVNGETGEIESPTTKTTESAVSRPQMVEPDYTRFFRITKEKGMEPKQALKLLGVSDWTEWQKLGGNLATALARLERATSKAGDEKKE